MNKKIARNIFSVFLITIFCIVLLELTLPILKHYKFIKYPVAEKNDFWIGDHPIFGVWHIPNRTEELKKKCFATTITTNSEGARDRERNIQANGKRIMVLGDSFIEGWGLAPQQRLTDLLEKKQI